MPTACRILHALPDLALGGGQQVVLRSILHADRERFHFHVCYFRPSREMKLLFRRARVPLLFLPHSGWCQVPVNLSRLVDYVRRWRIDLIHVHGTPLDKFYGMVAAAWVGVPVVRTLHGTCREPARVWARILRPGTVRRMLSAAVEAAADRILEPRTLSKVIAVSEEVRASWLPRLRRHGIRPDQITVNVNAVPTKAAEETQPEGLVEFRRELGLVGAWPVLISIGRITAAKGQDLLIPMVARLVRRWPKVRLLLVGDGELREPLRTRVRHLGLEAAVLFLGQRLDVSRLLLLSDAFLFTSHFEGVPLAVLEAMAAGKPVIAVEIPALAGVVKDGVTGRLVSRDPDALAEAVWAVLSNGELAADMGSQGQRLAETEYGMDRFIQTLERVYLSAISPPIASEEYAAVHQECQP